MPSSNVQGSDSMFLLLCSLRARRAGGEGRRPGCPFSSPPPRPGRAGVGRGCAVRSTMAEAARDSPEHPAEEVSGFPGGRRSLGVPRRPSVRCQGGAFRPRCERSGTSGGGWSGLTVSVRDLKDEVLPSTSNSFPQSEGTTLGIPFGGWRKHIHALRLSLCPATCGCSRREL